MTDHKRNSVFNNSGLAALTDLKSVEHKNCFSFLESQQEAFSRKESEFRSAEYKWPRNPLYDFSRVWEYPYVYHHLSEYIKALPDNNSPIVADVGSGVTFFPFSLAKLGYHVVCTDIDEICKKDLALASASVQHSPGLVDFRLISGQELPFVDAECDAVYCISVLEHIPDFEISVAEMHRVLKPGGLCLLTCDINLRPEVDRQLNVEDYDRLMAVLESRFTLIYPERTVHPADLITTRNSPYPRASSRFLETAWHVVKQYVVKPLIGRKPKAVGTIDPHVCVLGLVLRKT